ncbi:MAG: hypothetical protein M1819_006429 [Sarea resinae]|nr:MAG: hypothetical protein M1819_006429 [Sarea resinae]
MGRDSGPISENVGIILSTFNQVYLCNSEKSCRARIAELQDSDDARPIIIIVDIPGDHRVGMRCDSQTTKLQSFPATPNSHQLEESHGMELLRHVTADNDSRVWRKTIVPIAVIEATTEGSPTVTEETNREPPTSVRLLQCLEAGAADAFASPLTQDRLLGVAVHTHRLQRQAANEESRILGAKHYRKRSWVGVEEEKPYAYLREAMVSTLLNGICKPDDPIERSQHECLPVSSERRDKVADAIGNWSFSAHDFSDDELLYAALLILEHALRMPELSQFRMPTGDIIAFLMACRAAYNSFVLYHNFRHVIDVLQAIFCFLLRLGTLLPYNAKKQHGQHNASTSQAASLLRPFDGLTLLVAAIGHDVGHPGVNNAFLIALNAPLAQLYNDKSVLESFHCAAYSQILRRYWPAAFTNSSMRKLLISSILATDMGVHFDYMKDLGLLQAKLAEDGNVRNWPPQQFDHYRTLVCGLLIKCADISNVARKYEIAARWASILTDEFAHQGTMELALQMPTALFGGPPVRDSTIKMGESQIGFMNVFAHPLFGAITVILPEMQFTVDEIVANKSTWEIKIAEERRKGSAAEETSKPSSEDSSSPRSGRRAIFPSTSESYSEVIPSACQSPLSSSRLSMTKDSSSSRRSSIGALTQLAVTNPQLQTEARRSSLGSVFLPSQSPGLTSRRSSGALQSALASSLQSRHSSNAASSQLQLGAACSPENRGRRASGDHSLLTVLVTSPGSAESSTSCETAQTKQTEHGHCQARFSAPSSRRRSSQTASSANTPPYPPSTKATSLSVGCSEKNDGDGQTADMPAVVDLDQPGEEKSSVLSSVRQKARTVARRPSRFRLGFWRKQSRAQDATP